MSAPMTLHRTIARNNAEVRARRRNRHLAYAAHIAVRMAAVPPVILLAAVLMSRIL